MRRQQRQKRVRRLAARRAAQRRRGVLLLVVLSLLTLFLMIATAFLISAGQFRRANRSLAALAEDAANSVSRADFLDEVVGQLLRDTNNQNSSLRFHSLLRDLYGNDGLAFDLPDTATIQRLLLTGNQVVEIVVNLAENPGLSQLDDYYNGRVMTFANGGVRGVSARVIDYLVESSTATAINCRFRILWSQAPLLTNPRLPQPGNRVVINGAPFNGTGVGYDLNPVSGARLTAGEALTGSVGPFDRAQFSPLPLIPNAAFSFPRNYFIQSHLVPANGISEATQSEAWELDLLPAERDLIEQLHYGGWGGSDESYDAVDYQNMAMARLPVSPIESVAAGSGALSFTDPGTGQTSEMVIPSFHRPALLNYWQNQVAALATEPMLLRKVLMRPSWHDHPNFTGSNPDLEAAVRSFAQARETGGDITTPSNALVQNMIYGPWDLDNDGDGVRDSVWVDFGAPVIQGPNGKRVKPLAAILCVDMDGRLNINAHGSKDLAGAPHPDQPNVQARTLAGGTDSSTLPHGSGFGPADITLAPVLNPLTGVTSGQNSMFGRLLLGTTDLPGRYGWDDQFADTSRRGPGITSGGNDFGSATASFDLMAQVRMSQAPIRADDNDLSGYATPPDFSARYALGLNSLGQPVYEVFDEQNNEVDFRLTADSPYEIDLSENAPRGFGENGEGNGPDAPFSLAEFERVLRAYDADAGSLPGRIWDLAAGFSPGSTTPNLIELNRWRTLLTTDSYDLPNPAVLAPRHIVVGPDGAPDGIGYNASGLGIAEIDDFADVMAEQVLDPASGGLIFVERQPVNLSFSDLLEYRVRIALSRSLNIAPAAVSAEIVRAKMASLLPPELAAGEKLNINRPIGNGFDDNNNGVVDEPNEGLTIPGSTGPEGSPWRRAAAQAPAGQATVSLPMMPGTFKQSVFWPIILREDANNDNRLDNNDLNAIRGRGGNNAQLEAGDAPDQGQLLARHLYVLAMTVVDPLPPQASTSYTALEYRQLEWSRARRLAQWAVNCVDYRDPNSVMTGFEFDYDPFDGWDVDGNLTTLDIYGPGATPEIDDFDATTTNDLGGVVWGVERPELLITETLAWHDRNTEDTQNEENFQDGRSGKTTQAAEDPDEDFDQLRRPEGAFFLELYNPWPATPGANADTHAIVAGRGVVRDRGVNLAARASDGTPVWRLAVFKPNPGNNQQDVFVSGAWDPDNPYEEARPRADLAETLRMDRSVYFTQVDQPQPPSEPPFFTENRLATFDLNDGTEFFTTLDINPVRPGRFMVVGSGRQNGVADADPPDPELPYETRIGLRKTGGAGNPRSVVLDPTSLTEPVVCNDPDHNDVMPILERDLTPEFQDPELRRLNQLDRAICDVAIINQAIDETDSAVSRRLSISEPAEGYPDRSLDGVRWDTNGNNGEGWYGVGTQQKPIDTPLDDVRPDGTHERADGETRLSLDPAIADKNGQGVIEGFSWVYLQRLADPTRPFDAVANPYRTVDGMSVNVTVFNGRSGPISGAGGELCWRGTGYDERTGGMPPKGPGGAPGKPERYPNTHPEAYFASVQRGSAARTAGTVPPTAWGVEAPNAPLTGGSRARGRQLGMQPVAPRRTEPGSGSHLINATLDATLGFMGRPMLASGDNHPNARGGGFTATAPDDQLRPELVAGSPSPYPSIPWANRPFTSATEVIHVPTVSASQLLRAFSTRESLPAGDREERYQDSARRFPLGNDPFIPDEAKFDIDGPYGYTANFFRENDSIRGAAMPERGSSGIQGLYRVLDYIGVQSPYLSTETWLNPGSFDSLYERTVSNISTLDDPRLLLQPPFNRVPDYREPGRVNVNTIVNADVWDGGIMQRQKAAPNALWDRTLNNYNATGGHLGPLYNESVAGTINDQDDLVSSLRGYGNKGTSPLLLNNTSPTFFANPFRASDSSDLVPLLPFRRFAVDVTWNRRSRLSPGADNEWGAPGDDDSDGIPNNIEEFYETLSGGTTSADALNNNALLAGSITAPSRNTDRNPGFRYQPATRLASMTTTRSNVYAVWITIGFFEVEEAPDITQFAANNGNLNVGDQATIDLYNRVYPEGYALGREEGSDLGAEQRVRGFYMLDRSIPVAFDPGEQHNVERAIRLQRRIE